MNVVIGAKTDPGRRPNNEDQLAVVDVRRNRLRADGVLVIADGMGGRNSGEKASALAVEAVQDTLIEMLSEKGGDAVDTGEALASALRKANARVYEVGRQQGEEGKGGMGTTCVAAVLQGGTLSVAHAGDSRAYLLREGKLERLTDDHSYVAEQVRAGAISEESARRSRFRNVITRAVGIEPTITPDVSHFDVQPGDNLLLCTDGLTNMVPEDEIAQTLQYAPTPQAAAERLIQQANRNGGKDNITAVVARLEVSNRTQQMQAQDMGRPEFSNRTQQMQADELPPTRNGEARAATPRPRRPAPVPLWSTLSAAVILILLGVTGYLAHVLRAGGYHFQASRPFVRKAVPPPPPAPVDLAGLHYAQPTSFYVKPVQGGLLALDATDGSLTVITLSGQVVRLARDGSVLAQFPLPDKNSTSAVLPGVPTEGDHHFTVDTQGNLYDADAGEGFIHKYRADGDLIGNVTAGGKRPFQRLASLVVASDGTIYVIEAERLKVLRPLPPTSPTLGLVRVPEGGSGHHPPAVLPKPRGSAPGAPVR